MLKYSTNQFNKTKFDKIIQSNFSASYMSDTKWVKLIEALTDQLKRIYVLFKLIYSDEINGALIWLPDFEPFFIEPILYKEVEWIMFPKTYTIQHNRRINKIFEKEYQQDIDRIETVIRSVGEFMLERETDCLKLIAYR